MSNHSNSDTSLGEPPLQPPDSPGSSVSTRLQEEYDELLKYAVVVPDYNPNEVRSKLSDSRGVFNQEGEIITVRASTHPGLIHDTERMKHQDAAADDGDKEEEEEETTVSGATDSSRGGIRQLPDFGQSPVNSFAGSSTVGPTVGQHAGTHFSGEMGGGQPFLAAMFDRMDRDRGMVGSSGVDTVFTTTIDKDVGRMESMLDQWCLDLKRNVLAEFSKAKIIIEQKSNQDLLKERSRHASEKEELIKELNSMKEFLHTYEQTMERKDRIISNLTKAVYRQRDKLELMRNFCTWRLQHNDSKREAFAMQLAKQHYERCLHRRVLSAWFSLIHSKWRQRVEKACQNKAQQVCMQVTADYEAKILSLNEANEASQEEVRRLHIQREKHEEAMKKAFMRGVCALNMEAMSMFHGEEKSDARSQLPDGGDADDYYSDNLDSHLGDKGIAVSKSIPRETQPASSPREPPPPRVVTIQGARAGPPSAAPVQRPDRQRPSSGSSQKRVTAKGSGVGRKAGHPASLSASAPVASVVVERHHPVNKQTIGPATAAKLSKSATDQDRFLKLAGQGGAGKMTANHTIRVVE